MAANSVLSIDATRQPSWRGPYDLVLENGLRVIFVHRVDSPVAELRLILDGGGFAADPARRAGLAAAATRLFSDGLLRVKGTKLGSALDAIGAQLCSRVTPDAAVIGVSALKQNFRNVLGLLVSALANPEFEPGDLELVRANALALIAIEYRNPFGLALRLLPRSIYGAGHIYARPFSGSGTANGIGAITPDDLHGYYATYLAPQSTTLIVVGAWEAGELRSLLEQTFERWRAEPEIACPASVSARFEASPSIILVNRPGTSQTLLAAGLATVARNSIHAEALIVADTILAGMFSSRLNLSLRERKGWTYGVRSLLLDARLQGMWLTQTAVDEEHALQAMVEIAAQIEFLAADGQLCPEEFCRAISYLVARAPSRSETCSQIAEMFADIIIHRLPGSSVESSDAYLRRMMPATVTESWHQMLASSKLKWLVLGDAAELSSRLVQAGFSDIQVIEPGTQLP